MQTIYLGSHTRLPPSVYEVGCDKDDTVVDALSGNDEALYWTVVQHGPHSGWPP